MAREKQDKQTELIFGIHPIVELLKAKQRKLTVVYTTKPEPKSWDQIVRLLPKGTQIQYVTRDVLAKLAGTTDHQGVVAFASPFVYRKKFFDPIKQPFLLLLDSIQDPRNTGAIIRSAYCTGVQGVIIVEKAASPLTATALKSAAGLAEHMPIYQAPSTKAAVQLLREAGYTMYMAMVDKNAQPAHMMDYAMPLCVVIGNEGAGIAPEIARQGKTVFLPQVSPEVSYNASVAAGILLFMVATKTQLLK
ncbi:MAG: TrmH family RNA methyltransferase [Candidatus Babeliales bacterium]